MNFNKEYNYCKQQGQILTFKLKKAVAGAENWTLRSVDQKHLESFEMWCWRRMEKISWTYRVRN